MLNKTGSGGLKLACFNCERNPDINQREWEILSGNERGTLHAVHLQKSNGIPVLTRDSLIVSNTRKLGLTGGVVAYIYKNHNKINNAILI